MCFLTKSLLKNEERKNTRKNTPTNLQTKMQYFVSFFLLFSFSLFPFFLLSNPVLLVLLVLNFVFASTPCPRGRKGEGGRFVCKVWWWLWIYIYIYSVIQRGPGNRLNRSFLLVIVEIIIEIVGKQERRSCFFTFSDCGPILSEGPPGGGAGRDADTHTHTHIHIHIHIRQPVFCEDWSLTALSGVCMYVCMYVCVCVCVEQCKNDQV